MNKEQLERDKLMKMYKELDSLKDSCTQIEHKNRINRLIGKNANKKIIYHLTRKINYINKLLQTKNFKGFDAYIERTYITNRHFKGHEFIVKCPKCESLQNYLSKKLKFNENNEKKCINCGYRFKIPSNIVKKVDNEKI